MLVRRLVALWAAAAVTTALAASLLQGGQRLQLTRPPAVIPAAYRDGAPCIWLFVRAGCPHCEAHLAALGTSLSEFEPLGQHAALSRLRVIGSHASLPRGATPLPDSLRQALGVRFVPTTWLVDGEGRVVARWIGPRRPKPWRQAFDFVRSGRL
jgi:hypothetical protein